MFHFLIKRKKFNQETFPTDIYIYILNFKNSVTKHSKLGKSNESTYSQDGVAKSS